MGAFYVFSSVVYFTLATTDFLGGIFNSIKFKNGYGNLETLLEPRGK